MLDGTSQDIPELEGMYVTWDFCQCLRWYKSGHPGIFQDKGLEHPRIFQDKGLEHPRIFQDKGLEHILGHFVCVCGQSMAVLDICHLQGLSHMKC